MLKRGEALEDRGARRLAMEIGTLALDRRARASDPEDSYFETDGEVSIDCTSQ